MDFVDHLIAYFKKPKNEVEGTSRQGACPVCWGYQEYDSKIRTIFKDKHIDVKNHKDSYMKVQKFVVEHLDGVQHKEGQVKTCPSCEGKKKIEKETQNTEEKNL